MKTEVHILRVFVDHNGDFGSSLGVVMDTSTLTSADRHRITLELGFAETVFVENPAAFRIRIQSLTGEISFAGHAVVGVAWLLSKLSGKAVPYLSLPMGRVEVRHSAQGIGVCAPLAWMPVWWHERVASVSYLEALDGPEQPEQDATQLWAWIDESAGLVRARTFASRYAIPEEEACGSASMLLAATLGRELTICHGRGSRLLARPRAPGTAEVVGTVHEDGVRYV